MTLVYMCQSLTIGILIMIPSESNGDSNAIIPSNGDTEGFSVEQVHIIQINSYYQSGGGREEERRSVA